MKKSIDVARIWNAIVDRWILEHVPYRYQGNDPETGLDCWRGVVLVLYKMVGIEIPDLVYDEQNRLGQRNIGLAIVEQYDGLLHEVDVTQRRVGDIATFLFARDTHAGVMVDRTYMAHAMERIGVCRSRLSSFRQRALSFHLLRYHGPGADVFE